MPTSLSAKKRLRQNEKRRLQNKAVRSNVRTAVKKFRAALADGNLDEARSQLPVIQKKLDSAVAKGVYHKNTGARRKSRLSVLLAGADASRTGQ